MEVVDILLNARPLYTEAIPFSRIEKHEQELTDAVMYGEDLSFMRRVSIASVTEEEAVSDQEEVILPESHPKSEEIVHSSQPSKPAFAQTSYENLQMSPDSRVEAQREEEANGTPRKLSVEKYKSIDDDVNIIDGTTAAEILARSAFIKVMPSELESDDFKLSHPTSIPTPRVNHISGLKTPSPVKVELPRSPDVELRIPRLDLNS